MSLAWQSVLFAENVVKSGKMGIAIAGSVWYHSFATQSNSKTNSKDVFLPLGKTHPPFGILAVSLNDCVAANEALRFSCVASFGLSTFLL